MLFDEKKYGHLPHYLSLGAGVQSSTLALMYAVGELEPMPKAAIFADTQAEPASVYKWLDWLEKQLPYPVHRVTTGNLGEHVLNKKSSGLPVYTLAKDGTGGIANRGCTRDFKLNPLLKKLRALAEIKRGEKSVKCVSIIGISLDEIQRMKPSRERWASLRWPLVENRMRRSQCVDWMNSRGYPSPPRSACKWCPYHSNKEWRRLQLEEPDEFNECVEFEKQLRQFKATDEKFISDVFLHPARKPLDTIDFRSDVERGQGLLWDDECEGMCGV